MRSLDSVVGIFFRQIQKISSTNPKDFVDKSKKIANKYKKFHQQIQKILSTNPKNVFDKSKKIINKSKKICQQIQKK